MLKHAMPMGAVVILSCGIAMAAEEGASPKSGRDYLELAKAYADALIDHGRDTYGTVHSPLFAGTLDRKTMKIGRQPNIRGIRPNDRNLTGGDPQDEVGLYYSENKDRPRREELLEMAQRVLVHYEQKLVNCGYIAPNVEHSAVNED